MIQVKVRKFGNSLGVILPKEVLNHLKTGNGERLFLVEAADGCYHITSYDPEFERQMASAEEGMARYRNTLRALAK